METKKELFAIIDSFDSDNYDTEAMRIDASNNNFTPERAEEYLTAHK